MDLGVATNGAGDIQRAKLAATGLTSLFDGICVSEEIGARKPAYDHFEVAASLCGTRLSTDGWMVEDGSETDSEGGARRDCVRLGWPTAGRGPMASVVPTSWYGASQKLSRQCERRQPSTAAADLRVGDRT
ncbi:HAD family hydrolase [Streptomyces mirabilis]|uniref:HAD family hydrolase n=1 Tax=Streptomyces mirabilis TaxID=68239 RepID=UPI0036E7E372